MNDKELKTSEEEYEEVDFIALNKKRLTIIGIAAFAVCLIFPLIIYDSMGYAEYFRFHSGVVLDDDKLIRVIFGLLYFTARLSTRGFIPMHLFKGVSRLTFGASADNGLTVFFAVLILLTAIIMIVATLGYVVCLFVSKKLNENTRKRFDKIMSIVGMAIYAFATLILLIVIIALLAKLGGDPTFTLNDFLAYGAAKYILELVFSVLLGVFSLKLFLEMRRDEKDALQAGKDATAADAYRI